jgi:hypothetical protein
MCDLLAANALHHAFDELIGRSVILKDGLLWIGFLISFFCLLVPLVRFWPKRRKRILTSLEIGRACAA